MGLFGCKHVWEMKEKTYSPPTFTGSIAGEISKSTLEYMMFGVTCIEYQCKCGDHYTATLLGKQ